MKEARGDATTPTEGRFLARLRGLFTSKKVDESEITPGELDELADIVGKVETPEDSLGELSPDEPLEFDEPREDASTGFEFSLDVAEDVKTVSGDQLEELSANPEESQKTYHERLAALDFRASGNPNLKNVVTRRIVDWEAGDYPDVFLDVAEAYGIELSEVEHLFQKRVEELMERCHFFRATQTEVFLNHIISGEQRYKSQFETGTSNGILWPEHRSKIEAQICGFPRYDTPEGQEMVKDRPIYGYFTTNSHGILNETGTHPPWNKVCQYGRVAVKINRDVAMERATLSFCDSFRLHGTTPLSPAALPHYSCLFHHGKLKSFKGDKTLLWHFLDGESDLRTFMGLVHNYTEVQFHGGLTAKDIESIHVSEGNGIDLYEIDEIIHAVEEYNHAAGSSIPVVMY